MPSPFTNWMPSWPSGFIFDTVAALLGDERDLARRDEDPERARRKPKTPLQWIPVAWACIDLLTNELSGFPFTAYRRTYVEGYERPIKIPVKPDSKYGRLADMLTTDPCDQMNADLFWRHACWMTLATGNNYALMHRNERNEVVNLEPVTRITPPQSYPSMPLRMIDVQVSRVPLRGVAAAQRPGDARAGLQRPDGRLAVPVPGRCQEPRVSRRGSDGTGRGVEGPAEPVLDHVRTLPRKRRSSRPWRPSN